MTDWNNKEITSTGEKPVNKHAGTSDAPLLTVRGLRTSFHTDLGDVQAVRGIDFSVQPGESLGIVGESGCGKSVSMLSIMRLLSDNARLSAEQLTFEGEDILKKSTKEMRKIQGNRIGMIFQDPMTSLNPVFTIEEQLTNPLKRHLKMSKSEARAAAIRMLEDVGLPDPEKRLKQYPHELSGGMRQRVMIAIAMCCNPSLLIADEPTTALDVTIQAQILELMAKMKEEHGTSIILISHDLGVISALCTRVIVMYGGIIVEEGTMEDLFYRTGHPYTHGLLASIPRKTKEKLEPIYGTPPDLLHPPAGCPFAARCEHAMKLCTVSQPPLFDMEEVAPAGLRNGGYAVESDAGVRENSGNSSAGSQILHEDGVNAGECGTASQENDRNTGGKTSNTAKHRSACWLLHPSVQKARGQHIAGMSLSDNSSKHPSAQDLQRGGRS